MKSTRDRILQTLLEKPRSTINALAEAVGINPISVRHHLTNLQMEGLVEGHEERHGVGRPRLVYVLTDEGMERFPTRYMQLTTRLLSQMKDSMPGPVVANLFSQIAEELVGAAGRSHLGRPERRRQLRDHAGGRAPGAGYRRRSKCAARRAGRGVSAGSAVIQSCRAVGAPGAAVPVRQHAHRAHVLHLHRGAVVRPEDLRRAEPAHRLRRRRVAGCPGVRALRLHGAGRRALPGRLTGAGGSPVGRAGPGGGLAAVRPAWCGIRGALRRRPDHPVRRLDRDGGNGRGRLRVAGRIRHMARQRQIVAAFACAFWLGGAFLVDDILNRLTLANIPVAALAFALLAVFHWPRATAAGAWASVVVGFAWGAGSFVIVGESGGYTWPWAMYGIPLIFATGIVVLLATPAARGQAGHAYTTLACDVLARYRRARGYEVFFLTGTDEHGQKVEKAAQAKGETPLELADRVMKRFSALWEKLGISHTDFIRTSQERHKEAVQAIFRTIQDKGDIYLGEYEDWYCTPCETFWTETQLMDDNCPDCGRPTEKLKEASYFFRMSKYQEQLLAHIEANADFFQPKSRRNEILSFVREGLRDRPLEINSILKQPGFGGRIHHIAIKARRVIES